MSNNLEAPVGMEKSYPRGCRRWSSLFIGAEGACFQAHRPLFVVRTSARHRRRFSTGQPIVTTKNCEGEAKLRVLLHILNIDRVYPRVAIDVRP